MGVVEGVLLGVDIDVLEEGGGLGSWLVCWLGDGVLLAIMVFNDFRRSGFTLTLRRDDVFPVSVLGFSLDRNGYKTTIVNHANNKYRTIFVPNDFNGNQLKIISTYRCRYD